MTWDDPDRMAELGQRAYEQLVRHWARRDITKLEVQNDPSGGWVVVAEIYHDCDRAPSYYTHEPILGGLSQPAAYTLKHDIGAEKIG